MDYALFVSVVVLLLLPLNKASTFERTSVSLKSCRIDTDCGPNSFCFGNNNNALGTCKCLNDFYIFCNRTNYACEEPLEGVGSQCTCDEHCEYTLGLDSECGLKNTCECLPDAHLVTGKNSCYHTSRLNEACMHDDNCRSFYEEEKLYCTSGVCTCGLNLRPTPDGKCVRTFQLGEICDRDESCIADFSVCREVCSCLVGYVVKNDELSCLKAATNLGEKCDQLSQCNMYLENSICSDGFCNCATGYHTYGNQCYKNKFLNEICSSTKECVRNPNLQGQVECEGNVCICSQGYNPLKDCTKISNGIKITIEFLTLFISAFIFLFV